MTKHEDLEPNWEVLLFGCSQPTQHVDIKTTKHNSHKADGYRHSLITDLCHPTSAQGAVMGINC